MFKIRKSSSKNFFQVPKGTYDILPTEQIWWEKICKTVKEVAEDYGFGRIDTPILEPVEIFER